MEGMRSTNAAAIAACLTSVALGLSGCGGGERQDADEPKGDFRVEVVSATFPSSQKIADRAKMVIRVRNAGTETVPNVAMTVKTRPLRAGGAPAAFGQAVADDRLADNERPVWIVDRGPVGGDTAYTNTWALGKLRPGQSKSFEWQVTAVKPGRYTIDYEAAAGLDGRARVTSRAKASGTFKVDVGDSPTDSRVTDGGVQRVTPGGSADESEVSK